MRIFTEKVKHFTKKFFERSRFRRSVSRLEEQPERLAFLHALDPKRQEPQECKHSFRICPHYKFKGVG
jgi:hypothetical protein